ncbi:uncharacterized protein LOC122254036 isoform X2 [Penaeus japonicus]|uniref:uncharacterized protein LOC122254036 isoform X2 n=1 Tax=Penaeus japonicus TaxID=27405 RepID=UPI001C70BAD6|nr:uncharacterized protein LOC122254036 isoform X2 [Penaeus japonicus]
MWFPNGSFLVHDGKMHRSIPANKLMESVGEQIQKDYFHSSKSHPKYEKTKCPIVTRRETDSSLHQELLEIICGHRYLDMKNSAKYTDYTQIQKTGPYRKYIDEDLEYLLEGKSYVLSWRRVKHLMASEDAVPTPEEPRDAFRRRVSETAYFKEAETIEVERCPLLKLCRPCSVVLLQLPDFPSCKSLR